MSRAPSVSCQAAASGALIAGAAGLVVAAVLRFLYPWFLDPRWLAATLLLVLPCGLGALLTARSQWALPRPGWMLGAVATAFAGLLLVPQPTPTDLRMLVMGIDGASWEVIDPMIERGELPNLAAMKDQGAQAVLRSMEPMHSPRLWTTIATGKLPAEHGVQGFRVQSTDCRAARFWDVAEHSGLRVGIYKWLVSYPPREVDGFMVPSWLAPAAETWPPELGFVKSLELARRLRRRSVTSPQSPAALALQGTRHGLRLGTLLEAAHWTIRDKLQDPSHEERTIALQRLRARIDRDVFIATTTQQDVQLATFGYYATDALSHTFWEHPDPAYAEVVRDAYRQADAILGELLAMASETTTVAIFSDHGFRAMTTTGGSSYYRPRTKALERWFTQQGMEGEVARVGAKLSFTTLAPTQVMDEYATQFSALMDDQGHPLFQVERSEQSPDTIGLTIAYDRLTDTDLEERSVGGSPLSDFVGLAEGYRGEHDEAGIFLIAGPAVPAGTALPPMEQVDVSPTLQALMGLDLARDLPGQVVIGPAERGPASWDHLLGEHRFVEGASGVNEEQLRALGYVE